MGLKAARSIPDPVPTCPPMDPVTSDSEQPKPAGPQKKKAKGILSKAKGMFSSWRKPKKGPKPTLEADSKSDSKKKRKRGYWSRTKGFFSKSTKQSQSSQTPMY